MSAVTDLLALIAVVGVAQLTALAKILRDLAAMRPKVEAMWGDYTDPRTDGGRIREISVEEAEEGVDTDGDCP